MKKIPLFLFFISFVGFCQEDYLADLSIRGAVSELGVSPSEKLWVATKPGNTYYADSINALWHFGPLQPKGITGGGIFERVNFFSEDTLMISGYIHGDELDTDFVLWSGDGGKTWEEIKFGKESWIDAAYINQNGKAWMSGSSQLIYYTEDSGKTWKEFPKVEKRKSVLRFSTIHFSKDETIGLFGSFWNKIYKTTDNCKTWERIPTPLSQGKYQRLSKEHRPDIRKIRVLGDNYIVNQQGRVFHTRKDSINWTRLENVKDFEVSENESVYLIYKDLSVEMKSSDLRTVFQAKEKLNRFPIATAVRNNSLFALTNGEIYKIDSLGFRRSKLLTDDIEIPRPNIRLTYGNESYGFSKNYVLKFDKDKELWYRFMQLDFTIANATIIDDNIVLAEPKLDNRFALDVMNKKIEPYTLPQKLFDLNSNPVKYITFGIGSYGCFHRNDETMEYRLKNDEFIVKKPNNGTFANMPRNIPAHVINDFITAIDDTRHRKSKISDLEISQKDLDNFMKFVSKSAERINKKGIDRFESLNAYSFPGENTDFDFYKEVANRFNTLPDSIVERVFRRGSTIWSTTTNWNKIEITFQDGNVLKLANSEFTPNYLNTPWQIEYNGLLFKNGSIVLAKKIDALTRSTMNRNAVGEKNFAIFQIADYLYKQSLDD